MFYSLKNLVSVNTTPLEKPWEVRPENVPVLKDKNAWERWIHNANTSHHFISAFEGVTPTGRISDSEKNDPRAMHAIIVDYDGAVNPTTLLEELADRPPSEQLPAWAVITFSGHLRLIWLFSKPIYLPPGKHVVKGFLTELNKHIKFKKWYKAWDEAAYFEPNKYYDIGKTWIPVHPEFTVDHSRLTYYLYEATRKHRFLSSRVTIPMESIKAEIDRRFPGRWTGPFDVKERGLRFWDPTATDTSVCQVHPDGMLVFNSDPKPFMTWADIFGPNFVEQFDVNAISQIKERALYDVGNSFFWWKVEDGKWVHLPRDDFAQHLRTLGFDPNRKRGETASEIDHIEVDLKMNNRIDGACPMVFLPQGPIEISGRKMMNTARVKCVEPADVKLAGWSDGARYFPFIFNLLRVFFDMKLVDGMDELTYFLSWLKHFWINALRHSPQPGQGLVISGPEGVGKTVLVEEVIGGMVGGFSDAKDHIVDGSTWTDFIEYGIAKIDDVSANNDDKSYQRYVAAIKKLIANQNLAYNKKYRDSTMTAWGGRVIILTNVDHQSLRMIPTLESSSFTKLSFLRTSYSMKARFPGSRAEIKETIKSELPYFCRFLHDFKIPENVINLRDNRYLIKPFHHPDLLQVSIYAGASQGLYEIISDWIKIYAATARAEGKTTLDAWTGTPTELYRLIATTEGMAGLIARYDVTRIGRDLNVLASRRTGISMDRMKSKSRVYRVPFNLEEYAGEADPDKLRFEDEVVAEEAAKLSKENEDARRAAAGAAASGEGSQDVEGRVCNGGDTGVAVPEAKLDGTGTGTPNA